MVAAKICSGGHVCSPPKECCSLGCCYLYLQMGSPVSEMITFLVWSYWYLWAAVLIALIIAAGCGCWLWRRCRRNPAEERHPSDMASAGSRYPPPHYSRCSSFLQTLPPPYNEVTAKPDLYPLVIGYDEGVGKRTSGFVMRYFRSLSHASTLDSLSSSFMCNVVNEANTIIPPPYSCNNSVDELSERPENLNDGSIASLTNHRTTSDISSLAAQSPCSPPRATSPTIELRELLDKIQQFPQNRLQVLYSLNSNTPSQQPLSPEEPSFRSRRTRGKMYMPLGLPISSRNKPKRWLSRSAPTTPSGTTTPPTLLPGQSRRPSETDACNQQVVPLLSEQDETENACPLLSEHDEEAHT
ncbi:uncharacterized protein LOC107266634 isoform X2 [Cephus cinctus]|uniref:WW domain binding protein VOPP1 n=1 Tax=Cephus cinctus TaxID=211228 RepID=A0AAJ7RFP9_CEPCN|nr:uncharacterized protein LOC107266634 isoform X2 [Cephus cinctus]XP_024939779.1 uncharacterized protein LOC107266634 isoform X2 [Cephus cinctus]